MAEESADLRYGRALEAAHWAGYGFGRLQDELIWLLSEGRWRTVGPGFEHPSDFLRSIDLSAWKIEDRPKLARAIKAAMPEISNRAIAGALGVGRRTVDRDVAGPDGPPAVEEGLEYDNDGAAGGPFGPSAAPGGEAAHEAAKREAEKKQKKERQEARKRDLVQRPSPDGLFRVIYADPPWAYGSSMDGYGPAINHYPTLSLKEIRELAFPDGRSVMQISEDDAVLFLWAPSPLIPDALAVLKAWGFAYKSSFVWDKVDHNFGNYNSVRHELLLIGTKGSCTPQAEKKKLSDSVVSLRRTGTHSEKPGRFREIIDELYPYGSRLELFSRGEAPEPWQSWGSE